MDKKMKNRGMFAVKIFMLVEILQLIYLLIYISNCIQNPAELISGAIKFSQFPSIFEHIMMGVTLTAAGAFAFDTLS